jgi:hypothetical protein
MIVKIIRDITINIEGKQEALKKGELWCLPFDIQSQLIDECYAINFYGKVNSLYKEKHIPIKTKQKTVKSEPVRIKQKNSRIKDLINSLIK